MKNAKLKIIITNVSGTALIVRETRGVALTLEPGAPTQDLHVDFKRDADGWPMVGFILMVDEFRGDNGATRFVPGSHAAFAVPGDVVEDVMADCEGQVLACGPAGSIILYNGSVWHGHTANRSAQPRRSLQGAFIRREARSAINQAARIRPETLGRIGDLAKYLLDLETN
jgi:ectoine hydroxylase-related dioxygenase (phytanoyl-CoA dioxygenase family)